MAGGRAGARVLCTALMVLVLAGCGGRQRAPEVPLESLTAEEIYRQGEVELDRNSRKPEEAIRLFAEVERLYPYSEYAKRALIMQAFAQHRARNYEDARASAQRFLDFYPGDEDAAYAQYLLALSYYDQIDDVGRDQGLTFQALQGMREVIERYPDSEYASSAILKFDLAFDHLAGKEMEIGRYYLKRGHYAAAINRFRTVAILGYNYQASPFYDDTYSLLTGRGLELESKGDSWLTRIYRQVVRGEWL
jgi:outer membrane protein assembly factor BamD